MIELKVEGMTCAHCDAAVTRAIQSVDVGAKVVIDRKGAVVSVESSAAPEALVAAIRATGYAAHAA